MSETTITLPKHPIDPSKADSGDAPFDGKSAMLFNRGDDEPCIGYWIHAHAKWGAMSEAFPKDYFSHWSPLPEFVEVE